MTPPLVLVQATDARTIPQIDRIARGYQGRPLSPLLVGRAVRELGALAPYVCPCGCGRVIPAEEIAAYVERRAVLS